MKLDVRELTAEEVFAGTPCDIYDPDYADNNCPNPGVVEIRTTCGSCGHRGSGHMCADHFEDFTYGMIHCYHCGYGEPHEV